METIYHHWYDGQTETDAIEIERCPEKIEIE